MTDRYDKLAPKDIVITLRTLPRRYDSVVGSVQANPELFERIEIVGPAGSSFRDIVSFAATRLSDLADEAVKLARHQDPELNLEVINLTGTDSAPTRIAIDTASDSIAETAARLAELLDRLDADDWGRTAELEDGSTVDLVSLARTAVRDTIEPLRAAELTRDWLIAG